MSKLVVTACADCPFFGRIPLASAIEAIAGSDAVLAKVGICRFDRPNNKLVVIRLGLKGEDRDTMIKTARAQLPVKDWTMIPEECPLKAGEVVVSLGS